MADTFSPDLKIRLPQTGAYNNTWGAVLNSDAFTLLDRAIVGMTSVNIGSSIAYSLPALANGVDSASRYFCLKITGTPAAMAVVTVPASVSRKIYLVDNQTGQTLRFTYASSTDTADVANGERRLVWCDGTDCFRVAATSSDAVTLAGIPAASYARLDIANVFASRNSSPFITVTEGTTTTIDASLGNFQQLSLTGNRTMANPINPVDGDPLLLVITQDATGGRTLSWGTAFVFENGTAPSLSPSGAGADMFMMVYQSSASKWLVSRVAHNLGAASGASYDITLDSDVFDFNLLDRLGTVSLATTVSITLAAGCRAVALSTASYAMDLSGLPSGSVINLTNLGYIDGRGGDGGDGGAYAQTFNGPDIQNTMQASAGRPGGVAIKGPGSGCTLNITNGSGYIRGGGGGGGGGGASGTNTSNVCSNGGGGGGGAGGGRGGAARGFGDEAGTSIPALAGHGGTGTNGTFGAGSTGTVTGSATAGDGGAGGDWGADGTAGTSPSSTFNVAGGALGAGGKAIDVNAGTVNFASGGSAPHVMGAVS